MKKIVALVFSAVMALSLASCGSTNTSKSSPAQIPNPYTDCATLEDATKLAGFSLNVPSTIDGYPDSVIRAIDKELIEVIYNNGEKEIRIRKAAGTEDVSGDYNEYAENTKVDLGTLKITMRGSGGTVNVATWTDNGYTFAVSMSDGMKQDAALSLISAIK